MSTKKPPEEVNYGNLPQDPFGLFTRFLIPYHLQLASFHFLDDLRRITIGIEFRSNDGVGI